MRGKNAASAVRAIIPRTTDVTRKMSSRYLIVLVVMACVYQASSKPVRKTLNFNMFVLKPQDGSSNRTILATNGVSRLGPILEYLVQRVQGILSVRLPPEEANTLTNENKVALADASENEVDGLQESRMPGVVVRPSSTKPGTYELEIDVVVDDGLPNKID